MICDFKLYPTIQIHYLHIAQIQIVILMLRIVAVVVVVVVVVVAEVCCCDPINK